MSDYTSGAKDAATILGQVDTATRKLVKQALARGLSADVLLCIVMQRLIAAVSFGLRSEAFSWPRPRLPLSPGVDADAAGLTINARETRSLEERLMKRWPYAYADPESGIWPLILKIRGPERSIEELIELETRGEATLDSALGMLVDNEVVSVVDDEWVELIDPEWAPSPINARFGRVEALSDYIERLFDDEELEGQDLFHLQSQLLKEMNAVISLDGAMFQKLFGVAEGAPDPAAAPLTLEERMVKRWASDAEFLDQAKGRPARLTLRGSDGSFQRLIERETREAAPETVIAPLVARGAFRVIDEAWVERLDGDGEPPLAELQVKRAGEPRNDSS